VPRRLLVSLVVLVALGLIAGCADDVSPALRIGDTRIGNRALLDELDEWVGNEVMVDPAFAVSEAPGAVPGELARGLIAQRVGFELHNQEFERLGLELGADTRADTTAVVFDDPAFAEEALGGFSEGYRGSVLDDLARQIAVQEALGQDYQVWAQQAFNLTEIEVSPRYGTWDPVTRQVTAPAGPRSAPTASGQLLEL
jgi:hypothetical protein